MVMRILAIVLAVAGAVCWLWPGAIGGLLFQTLPISARESVIIGASSSLEPQFYGSSDRRTTKCRESPRMPNVRLIKDEINPLHEPKRGADDQHRPGVLQRRDWPSPSAGALKFTQGRDISRRPLCGASWVWAEAQVRLEAGCCGRPSPTSLEVRPWSLPALAASVSSSS